MPDKPPHPHDQLFRAVFSDPEDAAGLLKVHLPAGLTASLRWPTLALADSHFMDDDLREHASDLLFAVEHNAGATAWLYILIEHQSTPDRWMRLRLLTYCSRIWERERRRDPAATTIRRILPIVFYLGRTPWPHPASFSTLFADEDPTWAWGPDFQHILIDQTRVAPDAIRGTLRGRITQLALMAAAHDSWTATQRAIELIGQISAETPEGLNQHLTFVVYFHATLDTDHWQRFSNTLRRTIPRGDATMTAAEQLADHFRREGRQEGRREVIEALLQAGVGGHQEVIISGHVSTQLAHDAGVSGQGAGSRRGGAVGACAAAG